MVDRSTFEIPHLDDEESDCIKTSVEKHTSLQREIFSFANLLTDEVINANHIVIATPMYNWGTPSSLKAWIDRIVNTKTLYTTVIAGIPITIIVASGGLYSSGQNAQRDHLRPLLKEVFTSIGANADDIYFVDCDPSGPMDKGAMDPHDTTSAYSKAQALLIPAASRGKIPATCRGDEEDQEVRAT